MHLFLCEECFRRASFFYFVFVFVKNVLGIHLFCEECFDMSFLLLFVLFYFC